MTRRCLLLLLPLAWACQRADTQATPTTEEYMTRRYLHHDAHRLITQAVEADDLGVTHTRLRQTFGGVEIAGGDVLVHSAPDGTIRHGGDIADAQVLAQADTRPQISPEQAVAIVLRDLADEAPAEAPRARLFLQPQIERTLHTPPGQEPNADDVEERVTHYRLIYDVTAFVRGARAHDWSYEIDARSGAVVSRSDTLARGGSGYPIGVPLTGKAQYSGDVFVSVVSGPSGGDWLLADAAGAGNPRIGYSGGHTVFDQGGANVESGVYRKQQFYHPPGHPAFFFFGDGFNYTREDYGVFPSATSPRGETTAVDAMFAIKITSMMWGSLLGLNSFDNKSTSMVAMVHAQSSVAEAYWDPLRNVAVFADPALGGLQPTMPDIVGHEFAHGMFHYKFDASGLIPGSLLKGEFGGLSEANSDIMGTLVEFYRTANGGDIPREGGDWEMSSLDIGTANRAERYLYKPSKNRQPAFDAWNETIALLPADGNYIASGPMSRMFYFLSEGVQPAATGHPDFTSPNYLARGMAGIGKTAALRIWYRAMALYKTGASFRQVRDACLQVATGVPENFCSPTYFAVQDAFAAVNVGKPAWRTPPVITPSTHGTSGIISFAASVDRGFTSAQYFVDGARVSSGTGCNDPFSIVPFHSCQFDSRTVANGRHTLRLDVSDGCFSTSKSITFSVDNATGTAAIPCDSAVHGFGGGPAYRFDVDLGRSQGSFGFFRNTFEVPDTITLRCAAGGTIAGRASITNACESTFSQWTSNVLTFACSNSRIAVEVNPNCGAGPSSTEWQLMLGCAF